MHEAAKNMDERASECASRGRQAVWHRLNNCDNDNDDNECFTNAARTIAFPQRYHPKMFIGHSRLKALQHQRSASPPLHPRYSAAPLLLSPHRSSSTHHNAAQLISFEHTVHHLRDLVQLSVLPHQLKAFAFQNESRH